MYCFSAIVYAHGRIMQSKGNVKADNAVPLPYTVLVTSTSTLLNVTLPSFVYRRQHCAAFNLGIIGILPRLVCSSG